MSEETRGMCPLDLDRACWTRCRAWSPAHRECMFVLAARALVSLAEYAKFSNDRLDQVVQSVYEHGLPVEVVEGKVSAYTFRGE